MIDACAQLWQKKHQRQYAKNYAQCVGKVCLIALGGFRPACSIYHLQQLAISKRPATTTTATTTNNNNNSNNNNNNNNSNSNNNEQPHHHFLLLLIDAALQISMRAKRHLLQSPSRIPLLACFVVCCLLFVVYLLLLRVVCLFVGVVLFTALLLADGSETKPLERPESREDLLKPTILRKLVLLVFLFAVACLCLESECHALVA